MIGRRRFIMGIAVYLFCAPLAVDAQQAGKVPRVGVLFAGSRSDPAFQRAVDAFQQGLVELGYVEGRSIAIEYREAQGKYERLPDLAAELVRLKVDVIVGATVPTIQAARQATKTIPIVMTLIADPVATGLVASVARPAGNITGLSTMAPDLMGKQLELLREVLEWPSSGIRPIQVTHSSCERRRMRPGHWGCGFNPWRFAIPPSSRKPSRR